ncbi:MAG: hypothetical protein WAT94_00730 [Enterococcus aquimarinus]
MDNFEKNMITIKELQLSQLFLSHTKIVKINEWFSSDLTNFSPITIHSFSWSEKPVLIDGHTRAFVAAQNGIQALPFILEEDVISDDLENLYHQCVEGCKVAQLHEILDLSTKIISQAEYEDCWIGRCETFLAKQDKLPKPISDPTI